MTSKNAPADIPARPWLSADAHRWAAVRLPGWARPLWCAPVLLVAVIAAIAFSPDEVCTTAAPCGPSWLDAIGTVGFFVHMVWLFVLPEAALLSAPLLLLWTADPGNWSGGTAERVADVVVVAVLCWSWAAVVARLRMRRRQRALALEAAGGVALPVPDPVIPARRGVVQVVAGTAGLAVAAVAAVIAVTGDRADEAHAAAAARIPAVVVANGADDHIVVRFEDGSRHSVEVMIPEDYERGTGMPVLVDGGWLRLAAEPYHDRTGLQLLALVAGGGGAGLLLSGALAAVRARSVRRGPAPALRVLARHEDGFTVIRPVDDADGPPVLRYEAVTFGGAPRGESFLFGLPAEAGALELAGTDASGGPVAEVNVSSARPWSRPRPDRHRRRLAEHRRESEARVAEAAAALRSGAGPVRWRSGPVSRIAGVLVLMGLAAVLASHDYLGDSWWHWTLWLAGCWMFGADAVGLIMWRITADADGLRLRRHLRTRHVPWAEVTRVVTTPSGDMAFRRANGLDDIRWDGVTIPSWERALRRPSPATRAAAELTAMIRDPGLRP
ncbi:PH domain-containing protein [Streptomyces sp. NPDC058691]|uniref:PH domain-containing protein n=1 Tax=Streptomyces sp. NPDC058691 TaxID=3346601 RepID=UPI0036591B4F